MLGHDYISDQPEVIPAARGFERLREYVVRLRVGEKWFAVIATEGYKMEIAGLLVALQSPGHDASLGSLGMSAL